MARIQLLDDTLVDQIAAGEVIERPAAVVKELVENSLDANARRIEVELLGGGLELIRVRDDGMGMSAEDAALSLRRHATSKLRSKEDLERIQTFGFRGEALPSIAAVSRFVLLTAEPDALGGVRIELEGGRPISSQPAAAPAGTSIEVRDLFWNVPARRKFLKRAATEQSHALEAVLRLAMIHGEVEFAVREGGRSLLHLAAGEPLDRRAEEALGRSVRGRLWPFDTSLGALRAHGLCGGAEAAASSGKGIWLFVNGRAVRDRSLSQAVVRAYAELLPGGRYPSALVFLELPLESVDVNVHPAKAEVRLADPRAAFEVVRAGVAAAIGQMRFPLGSTSVEAVRSYAVSPVEEEEGRRQRVAEAIVSFGAGPAGLRRGFGTDAGWQRGAGSPREVARVDAGGAPESRSPLRLIGQLGSRYLVCERAAGLALVDRHAAAARIRLRALGARVAAGGALAHPLLVPRVLAVGQEVAVTLEGERELLESIGIGVAAFGGGAAAVKVLPAGLAGTSDEELAALLAELAGLLADTAGEGPEARRGRLLERAACTGGREDAALSPEGALAMIAALEEPDSAACCAHGRSVVVEWTFAELEARIRSRPGQSTDKGGRG
jgi:DNA mismatch repair protein MutL